MKNILHMIKRLVRMCCLGYMLLLALLVLPQLFGIQIRTVTSASMSPAIRTGAVVYIRKVPFSEIKIGDVVTYSIKDTETMVTHRVVEKMDASGQFRTKGDANEQKDAGLISADQMEGKVIFSLPWLGILALFLSDYYGKIVLIVLLIMSLFLGKEKRSEEIQK